MRWRGANFAIRKTKENSTKNPALPRLRNIAESWQKGGSEALVKQGHNPITSEDALDFSGVSSVEVWSVDLFTNGREPLCH